MPKGLGPSKAIRPNEENRYVDESDLTWKAIKKRLNLPNYVEDVNKVRNLDNAIRRDIDMTGSIEQENMNVPHPTMFQPDPLVVGDPWEARIAQKLLDLDPQIKQNVSRVYSGGPSPNTLRSIMGQNFEPREFNNLNLEGAYSPNDKTIDVVPRLGQHDFIKTLLHEMSHAAGTYDTGRMNAYEITDRLFGKRK